MSSCHSKHLNTALTNYNDVLSYLDSLGLFHMDMGLERMTSAVQRLDIHIPCPIIQVVGTNGKGSTATFLHSLALAHGFRAGIFTSPHFLSPTERIRMNEKLLPEAAWANLANQALAAEPKLTYFELLTVMSLLAFAFSEPDLLIYEAGLGGTYDATSAIGANMLCISPIDFDHTAILGNDIQSITTDKVGAMHKDMFAIITAPQSKEATRIIEEKSHTLNIPLYSISNMAKLPSHAILETQELGLKGAHQRVNAQTALTAWHVLCKKQGWFIEPNSIQHGLAQAFIPGRFQYIDDTTPIILDGAHNEHSMKSLIQTLKEENIVPSAIIFSCLSDKQPQKLVALLENFLEEQNSVIPVIIPNIPNNERAMPPDDIARIFKTKATPCTTMQEALKIIQTPKVGPQIPPRPILICGSLYLLAEYYSLYPHMLKK